MEVHKIIDPLWKSGKIKRQSVYKMLADKMGLDRTKTHVGMFDVDECKKAIEVMKCSGYSKAP